MAENSKEGLLTSMRNTLRLMQLLGVPKEVLVEVLDTAAKELREELAREGRRATKQ